MDTITDALIGTLADVHARADVSFDLDSAITVLETAQATLQSASPDEKHQLEKRATALATQSRDPDFAAFLTAFIAGLNDPPS